MADVPVEVNKTAPAQTPVPDGWRSFRSEMDRLFDRFGFPSLRRMFEIEPPWRRHHSNDYRRLATAPAMSTVAASFTTTIVSLWLKCFAPRRAGIPIKLLAPERDCS